jgi:hypothetical protein
VPLRPAGGIVPIENSAGTSADQFFQELEKYGVRREDRSLIREEGKYVFRASVTTSNGTKRSYTNHISAEETSLE